MRQTMMKTETGKKIQTMFVLGESLSEKVNKENNANFHKEVIASFGSWRNALRTQEINKTNLKNRDRFLIYYRMKRRFEQRGDDLVRHKSVDHETKMEIKRLFGTHNKLMLTIKTWNEDKVMYELRAALLTGSRPSTLSIEHPQLFEQIEIFFDNIYSALSEYQERFGREVTELSDSVTTTENEVVENEKDSIHPNLDDLVRLGYLDENEAKEITELETITTDEIDDFLMALDSECKEHNINLTEARVKETDIVMFKAITKLYGNVENALSSNSYHVIGRDR